MNKIFLIFLITITLSCKGQNTEKMEHNYTNALINSTSPYLLQHAHNPVNWQPWSDELIEKAKAFATSKFADAALMADTFKFKV